MYKNCLTFNTFILKETHLLLPKVENLDCFLEIRGKGKYHFKVIIIM